MKKKILIIAITGIILFAGLSSAVPVKSNDRPSNKSKLENEIIKTETEFPKIPKIYTQSGSDGWQKFVQEHGIKIWAKGYGTLNCKLFDEDHPYYEFTDGNFENET